MALLTSELATWLAGLGVQLGSEPLHVLPGPFPTGREPTQPDVIAVVAPAGGAPPVNDGLFEQQAFQVAVRGPQRRVYDERAFRAAWDMDRAIRFAPLPGYIGSTWCPSVMRSSAAPTVVMPLPDAAERITFTATYLFTASAF